MISRDPEGRALLVRPAGLLALVLAVVLGACDGRNLFQPVNDPPTVVALTAPPTATLGGVLPITVRAVAVIPIDSIVITVEGGGLEAEITLTSEEDEPEFDMLRELEFELPLSVGDFTVRISAVAIDEQENVSARRYAQVALVDGTEPSVTGQVQTDRVGQGETLRVQVSATDNVGLALIGMRVRDEIGLPIVNFAEAAQGMSASAEFEWDVPQDLEPGTYRVQAYADDQRNQRRVVDVETVEVEFRDIVAPQITIETPEPDQVVLIGDSVLVRVRVQDEHEFRTVRIQGFSYRGDPDFGTDETIERFEPWTIQLAQPVADTTLTRYLRPAGGDTTVEPVFVIVTSSDLAGNVGADTVRVQVQEDADPEEGPQS